VLIALWDGGPSGGRGGTAEIVDAARRAGLMTIVIPVERATPRRASDGP
jgi:precorrin-6x reductase